MLDTVWKCSQLCVKSKDLEPQGVRKYITMGKFRVSTEYVSNSKANSDVQASD